jgi:hypothetical protein
MISIASHISRSSKNSNLALAITPLVLRVQATLSNRFVHCRTIHCTSPAMTTAPALSTLHHVTERKLKKLARHQAKFEVDKNSILASVSSASGPRAKVEALLYVHSNTKTRLSSYS